MTLLPTALVDLVQAKNYLRLDHAASLKVDAEYVGLGDGTIVAFTLDHAPLEGTLRVYVDSILKTETTHYTYSGTALTFTAAGKPANEEGITASYDYTATEDTFEAYDDDLLETLIEAATKKAEDYTERAFVQREITETHIGDNKQVLKLYKQPVVADSISSITIGGDALTTYSQRLSIGRIYHLVVWPGDYEIVVVYTAGSAETRAAVQALLPDAVAAVLLIVADLFENRGDKIDSINISGLGSTSYKMPSRALELLNPLRMDVL